MKPFLALFRAGKSSLHPHAVERLAAQNFDYALSWFGDQPPQAEGAVFVHMQKGAKWPGLYETIGAQWDLISQYSHVWLPDDDLLCVPEDVSRMFQICQDFDLELAQPALTVDSFFAHVATLQHSAFQLRLTNFVEIMAPVLSLDMLTRVYPMLRDSISGYGMDSVWPRLSQLGKIAIIDATPVKHTRALGGPNYAFSAKAGLSPVQEDWMVSAAHFVETPSDLHLNYGGLLQSGDAICVGPTPGEIEQLLQALVESCSHLPLTALQLTRYLSNHLAYWAGPEQGALRYPRSAVRAVLEKAFARQGLRFVKPRESGIGRPGEMRTAAVNTH